MKQGALILLYRLLFVLYAEDRNLLPNEREPYKDFALPRLRDDIAEKFTGRSNFSDRSALYWARLKTIFRAIGEGDDTLGIPPYNGGLFQEAVAPILARAELPDKIMADVIFRLSHGVAEPRPKYINYRDLLVQQLGSIYERLLEYDVVAENKSIEIRTQSLRAQRLRQLLHAGAAGEAHYRAHRRPAGQRMYREIQRQSGGIGIRPPTTCATLARPY